MSACLPPERRRPDDAEHREQCALVETLRDRGVLFAASLNGARLPMGLRVKVAAAGMERGEPDLRIYDPPPCGGYVGMMIEMKAPARQPKTSRAHRWSGAAAHQKARLLRLEAAGWLCVVAYSCDDALGKMRDAGYDVGGEDDE